MAVARRCWLRTNGNAGCRDSHEHSLNQIEGLRRATRVFLCDTCSYGIHGIMPCMATAELRVPLALTLGPSGCPDWAMWKSRIA